MKERNGPGESAKPGTHRCVFFDRDGVVNCSPGTGYVTRWDDFVLMDGFVAALRTALRKGYVAVIVTNQRAVALGEMSREEVEAIHANLRRMLRDIHGIDVLDILYCPHDRGECTCRKPQPGMLREAARRHGIDLTQSWMVGDQPRDVEAGVRAGCRTVFVGRSREMAPPADHTVEDIDSLSELLSKLL